MNVEKRQKKLSLWEQHRHMASEALDLGIKELLLTCGGAVSRERDDRDFIVSLYRQGMFKPGSVLGAQIREYLDQGSGNDKYTFEEIERKHRVGKIRNPDLRIIGHFSHETRERYVVIDLSGRVNDGTVLLKNCPTYVRFEAWCRLYYSPISGVWQVHFIDMTIRHKKPMERVLLKPKYVDGKLIKVEVVNPEELCLFFNSSQGGTWG